MLIKLAWRSMVRTRIGFAHGRRVGRCRYGDSLGECAFDAENVGAAQATQLAELAGGVRPEQIAGRGFVGAVLVDSGKPSDDFLLRPAVEQNALKKDRLDEPKCVLGIASPFQSPTIPANIKRHGHLSNRGHDRYRLDKGEHHRRPGLPVCPGRITPSGPAQRGH